MCYFHVLQNVRKKKHMMGDYYDEIIGDIRNLHYCTTKNGFNKLKNKVLKKWETIESLIDFSNYFRKQWLDGVFCNWAIFSKPAGCASTNNPVESHNAIIKKFFTNRFKFNFLPCLLIFKDTIECMHHKNFKNYRKVSMSLKDKAKKTLLARGKYLIERNNKLFKYKSETSNKN